MNAARHGKFSGPAEGGMGAELVHARACQNQRVW